MRTKGGNSRQQEKTVLTAPKVAALKPGEWAAEWAPRGAGRLQVRRLARGGLVWYYRYTADDGERVRLVIGSGLSLKDARAEADELKRRYQAGERDLRGALEAEQREAERQREAAKREAEAEASEQRATLGALLSGYVEQLQRDGKASAREVERALRRHVEAAWPVLWDTPASDVSTDDLLAVVAVPSDDCKLREASKLRAYLRAAYSAGIRARQDARALPALRALRLGVNPARDLATIEGASQTRERALSVAELRAYWRRIERLPDPTGALLRFHLLTGGQRIEQLSRVTIADWDADSKTVRLRDGKGRRKQPRRHDVPVIAPARQAMKAMQGGALGPYLVSITAGESGISYPNIQHRLRAVVEAMTEADELPGGNFTVGDIRRTVETRLAALGVSVDVRAQLQSHGLGGVQQRHYDRHDYLPEKRAALETLHRLLTGAAAKVTPIKRKSA